MADNPNRIGFVSTRLAGTDGVSLETRKWVHILGALDYECFFLAGESDWPEDLTYLVPEAHFNHPDIRRLEHDLFDDNRRSPDTSAAVQTLKEHLKQHLYNFYKRFDLNLLIIENALSLPVNIPLGLALTEFIAETCYPAIAHHHDFAWERERFAMTAAGDYLRAAFPPTLPSIQHVVINSFGARQLALRTGMSSVLIPNVMDFETPSAPPDEYARGLRAALNLADDEYLLLQPTRIVPRKRIEHALILARRLNLKCALVVSHAGGDEGTGYADYLRDFADAMNVRMILTARIIDHSRGHTADGRRIFSLADAYQQADLVTYPSSVEGFGNAFLETICYRRPIVMSAYNIFETDIRPKGFKVISFEDFITEDTVQQAREVLLNPANSVEQVNHNYELGRRYYSYQTLENRLVALMNEALGAR